MVQAIKNKQTCFVLLSVCINFALKLFANKKFVWPTL